MVAWNKALVSTWSQFVVDSLGGQILFTLIIIGCTTLMAMLMAFVPIRWHTPQLHSGPADVRPCETKKTRPSHSRSVFRSA